MKASGVNQCIPSPVRDTPIHIKGTMTMSLYHFAK